MNMAELMGFPGFWIIIIFLPIYCLMIYLDRNFEGSKEV